MFIVILSALLFYHPAYASDENAHHAIEAERAEYIRISDTMVRLSKRKIWSGVSKQFEKLSKLKHPISFDHLLIGAQAAQELGEMALVKSRLQSAVTLKDDVQLKEWLNSIEQNYGMVSLKSQAYYKPLLIVKEWPLDPIQVKSIQVALNKLESGLEFTGLLPNGDYVFIDETFTAQSGIGIELNINPKQRRKNSKKR